MYILKGNGLNILKSWPVLLP